MDTKSSKSRWKNLYIDRQTHKHTHTHTHTHSHTDTDTQTHTHTHTRTEARRAAAYEFVARRLSM